MTAPDPQRAVAEARTHALAHMACDAVLNDSLCGLDCECCAAVDAFERAVRADERARLLATQEDADAHAPGYDTGIDKRDH